MIVFITLLLPLSLHCAHWDDIKQGKREFGNAVGDLVGALGELAVGTLKNLSKSSPSDVAKTFCGKSEDPFKILKEDDSFMQFHKKEQTKRVAAAKIIQLSWRQWRSKQQEDGK